MARSLLRGSSWVMLFKVLGAGAGYVFAWLVARAGGAAAYGLFEWGVTVVMVGAMVARMGLDGAAVRMIAGWEAEGRGGWVAPFVRWGTGVVLGVSLLLGGLGAVGGAGWLGVPGSGVPGSGVAGAAVCIGVPLFAVVGWWAEVLRGSRRMVGFSMLQQGTVVAFTVPVWGAVSGGWLPGAERWSAGEQALVAFCLAGAGLGVWGAWSVGRIGRRQEAAAGAGGAAGAAGAQTDQGVTPAGGRPGWFRRVAPVAGPMWVSGVAFLAMSSTDTLLLEAWMGDAEVGVYRLALRLAAFITFTQFAINAMATPMFRALHVQQDRPALQRLLGQIARTNFLLSTPILLLLLFFPDAVLGWFGEEFGGRDARALLAILGVAGWVNANCGPVLNLLNMTGWERVVNRVILASAVLNLLLNLWWIPLWGLQGAAWATAVSTVFWNGISVWLISKKLGVWTILGMAGRGR